MEDKIVLNVDMAMDTEMIMETGTMKTIEARITGLMTGFLKTDVAVIIVRMKINIHAEALVAWVVTVLKMNRVIANIPGNHTQMEAEVRIQAETEEESTMANVISTVVILKNRGMEMPEWQEETMMI